MGSHLTPSPLESQYNGFTKLAATQYKMCELTSIPEFLWLFRNAGERAAPPTMIMRMQGNLAHTNAPAPRTLQ